MIYCISDRQYEFNLFKIYILCLYIVIVNINKDIIQNQNVFSLVERDNHSIHSSH